MICFQVIESFSYYVGVVCFGM